MLIVSLLLLACAEPAQPDEPDQTSVVPPSDAAVYAAQLRGISSRRASISTRWDQAEAEDRDALVDEARILVGAILSKELLPTWLGTSWAFYGMTRVPRHGHIACGYLVSTVLEDAGFQVERVKLAQQASEHIIETMSPADQIHRYRGKSSEFVANEVLKRPDGVYIVGLDFHVGFLVKEGNSLQMCHSDPTQGTQCEAASTAVAFESNYRVVGPVLTDGAIVRWLENQAFVTVET